MDSFVDDFARLVVECKREFKSYLYLLILWSEVQEWNMGWNQDILTFAVSSSVFIIILEAQMFNTTFGLGWLPCQGSR